MNSYVNRYTAGVLHCYRSRTAVMDDGSHLNWLNACGVNREYEMPQYHVQLPADVAQAVGQLIAQWSHVDDCLTADLRILLGDPRAKAIPNFPEHLRGEFNRRVNIYRELRVVLFDAETQKRISKALDKICNLRAAREHLVHGTITTQDDGRLLVAVFEELPNGERRAQITFTP